MTLSRRHLDEVIPELLTEWLPHQRWFGGKQRAIGRVRVVRESTLYEGGAHEGGADEARLEHLIVAVAFADEPDSDEQLYQLLIGLRRDLPDRLEHARIGGLSPIGPIAYDATHDADLTAVILELIGRDTEVGGLRFSPEPGASITTGLHSRPISAEQSNTSVIYGDSYIMKVFRKLQYGVSPDLELHRALSAVDGRHIAELYGAIEGTLGPEESPVTYGVLQRFFANCADGWSMAIASVRDLIAEADLHPDEVGGDFAAEACRLGQAVAAVHADLARALGTEIVPPGRASSVAAQMNARLDETLRRVARLQPYEQAIRAVFEDVTALDEPVVVQRIHGDLHLGQVLRTLTGWVLIDFEGEPSRPLAERVALMTPLRDVAGMLRSFDYAAHHLLVDAAEATAAEAQLEYRAMEWATRNRDAFCEGYATGGTDPREHPALMRALELEKAVYEVGYEYDNRPSWMDIPLRSIARLVA